MDPAWIIDEAPAGALISSFSPPHLNIPGLEPCDDVSEAWRPISTWAGLKLKVWLLLLDRQAEPIFELLFFKLIHHLLDDEVLERDQVIPAGRVLPEEMVLCV